MTPTVPPKRKFQIGQEVHNKNSAGDIFVGLVIGADYGIFQDKATGGIIQEWSYNVGVQGRIYRESDLRNNTFWDGKDPEESF